MSDDAEPTPAVPDAATGIAPPSAEYFELDGRRATFREYSFETKNPLILAIAMSLKLLRIRMPGGSTDNPTVDRLAPFEVSMKDAPDAALSAANPLMMELEALGFIDPVVHVIDTPLQSTQHLTISMRDAGDPTVIGRVHVRIWHLRYPPKVKAFVEFLTALTDGTYVWTLSGKPDTIEPDHTRWERLPAASARELRDRHRQRSTAYLDAAVPVSRSDDVRQIADEHHAEVIRFHLDRGFFTAVDATTTAAIAEETGHPDQPVLLQIDRLLNGRPTIQGTLALFGITLFAFIALGANQWGWQFLLLLLPILFFHELGHYVTMRGFGYRGVRMFFLPLLGAAVSGRSFNVATWKQVVVALAGPLPGIAIAIPLGIGGAYWGHSWMTEAALVALLVNGFNLLPVMPLDGGRVAHLLLFRRHPLADLLFRIVAVAALFGLGLWVNDHVLLVFPMLLGMSIPSAYRTARVTAEMRMVYPKPVVVAANEPRLPPEIAHQIIPRLKARSRRPVATKILAMQTLEVLEALNSPSPGWRATLGFGLLHLASIAAVLVGGLTIVLLSNHRGTASFTMPQELESDYAHVLPAEVRSDRATDFVPAARHDVILGEFEHADAARLTYTKLVAHLPSASSACLSDAIVIVEVPLDDLNSRAAIVDELERGGAVATLSHGGWIDLNFGCDGSEKRLEEIHALAGATSGPSHALMPPWIDPDPRTADLRAIHERARRTFYWISREHNASFDIEKSSETADASREAERRGQDKDVKKLRAERLRLAQSTHQIAIDRVRAKHSGDIDEALLKVWAESGKPTEAEYLRDDYREASELAVKGRPLMDIAFGQLALLNPDEVYSSPTPEMMAWWSSSATRQNAADHLTLNVRLRSPTVALPAISRWLHSRVNHVTFDVSPGDPFLEVRFFTPRGRENRQPSVSDVKSLAPTPGAARSHLSAARPRLFFHCRRIG